MSIVAAAKKAFRLVADPAAERSRVLLAIADAGTRSGRSGDHRARMGKPIGLAPLDIPRAVANLRFFAAILHTHSEHATDGAALFYTACCWRRGLHLALASAVLVDMEDRSALATGNTVVAKPSEITPMTAPALARIARGAGLPPAF
jgi:aminomuconate-semialdehyde/2-hydroxymuconate-6-semialdehyde dehydrogenase